MPIINIIDHVFAATNSAIKYGSGSIFACLQKKQINGVKVNITISLDVNIVSIDINKYNEKNKAYWLALNLFINLTAI